jgi:hypothetical protein
VPKGLVLTLSPESHDALSKLAALRFGDNRSRAVEWAVAIAAAVLADPATIGAAEPADALLAHRRSSSA